MSLDELNLLYNSTELSSNMEDYLETIIMLSEQNKVVRVKDIAKKLNIKMPSVTAALNKLKDANLIEYEKYGFIELTSDGESIAQRVYNRHNCLNNFFNKFLLLNAIESDKEACKVEHNIQTTTCIKIHKLMDFFEEEQANDAKWIEKMKKAIR